MGLAVIAVLLLALVATVFPMEISGYYLTNQNSQTADQVCTESEVGPRAKIYCYGRILESVMAFDLYNDSKTFVGEFFG